MQEAIGRRFHLQETLGVGTFGQVYLAEQESPGGFRRPVAIKLLHAKWAHAPEVGQRMRDEARILGRLNHRHIVAVLDLVRVEEGWAVVMDYVPGADLEEVVGTLADAGQRVPPPAALTIGASIARALHAASEARGPDGEGLSVIHRDIKPSNVRMTEDGDIKVLDFGVAQFTMEGREAETQDGWRVGTRLYMAPERMRGDPDTLAGDVYSVGATLFELLTGRYLGQTPIESSLHTEMVDKAIGQVRQAVTGPPQVVDELCAFLRQLVDVDPEARPQPDMVAQRLEAMVAKLDGESLLLFARRAIPMVEGEGRTPAHGTLVERTSYAGTGIASATIHLAAAPPSSMSAGTLTNPGPWALPTILILSVVTALSGIGILGLAGYMVTRFSPSSSPTESGTPPIEAREAPAEVVEPVVVEIQGPEAILEAETTATINPAPEPRRPRRRKKPRTEPVPEPAPEGPPISRAQFSVKDASSVQVTCGSRVLSSTASVRMTDFPPGPCEIEAKWLGEMYQTQVVVNRPTTVRCAVIEGTLSCD